MKLSVVLYTILFLFNFLSLCFIIDLFFFERVDDFMRYNHRRCMFYILYLTLLLNMYFLCYSVIKKRFEK